jgi:hypothetical protein
MVVDKNYVPDGYEYVPNGSAVLPDDYVDPDNYDGYEYVPNGHKVLPAYYENYIDPDDVPTLTTDEVTVYSDGSYTFSPSGSYDGFESITVNVETGSVPEVTIENNSSHTLYIGYDYVEPGNSIYITYPTTIYISD